MKKVYKSFNIAGIEYYEALFTINELKVGDKLFLEAEPNNIHDENAVAIYYKDFKLGYIPRAANYSISVLLNASWDIFEAFVQKINRDNLEISVAVFVKNNKDVLSS
jgi:hypothetical protein